MNLFNDTLASEIFIQDKKILWLTDVDQLDGLHIKGADTYGLFCPKHTLDFCTSVYKFYTNYILNTERKKKKNALSFMSYNFK